VREKVARKLIDKYVGLFFLGFCDELSMVLRKKKRVVNDSCNISWVTCSLQLLIIIRYRNKCKGCGRLEYTFYCVLAEKQMKLLFSEINSTHLEIMQSH